MRFVPGLSTYDKNTTNSAEYLRPLLEFAANIIPAHKHKETPLYIMATAGMRLIDQKYVNFSIVKFVQFPIDEWFRGVSIFRFHRLL